MAVIWQKNHNGSHYEIRKAGNSVRLYTDGIFHSQWNPVRPVGGNIWELLFLPALFRESGKLRRVLVLGVGGGAVINLLERFVQPGTIIGVDLDAVHLDVARRYFGVNARNTRLVRAEAVAWLRRYRGASFDFVVEDLFRDDGSGEPVRAVTADATWLQALRKVLAPGGILVMNHESSRQLGSTATLARRSGIFDNALQLKTPHYNNAIGVFSNAGLERKALDRRLSGFRQLDRRYSTCKLNFSLRRV